MKIGKLVYIEWVDASSNSGWMSYEDAEEWIKKTNWRVKQIGWIISETKYHLVIAGRLEDDSGHPLVGMLQKIPKTWIIKRRALNEKK